MSDNNKPNKINPKLYAAIEDKLNLCMLTLTKKVMTFEELTKNYCINKSHKKEKTKEQKTD